MMPPVPIAAPIASTTMSSRMIASADGDGAHRWQRVEPRERRRDRRTDRESHQQQAEQAAASSPARRARRRAVARIAQPAESSGS